MRTTGESATASDGPAAARALGTGIVAAVRIAKLAGVLVLVAMLAAAADAPGGQRSPASAQPDRVHRLLVPLVTSAGTS
jgi:hypothetical protein